MNRRKLVYIAVDGLMIFILIMLFYSFLGFIQQQYLPVVEYIEARNVYHDDDYNHDISGVLKKSNWAPPWICSFNRIDASMQTPVGWERIAIEYFDQPENASITRNEGESVFGVWKLKTASQPDAREVRLDVHHNCLPLPFSEQLGLEIFFMKARTTIMLDLDAESH